jgi:hypothetical protein
MSYDRTRPTVILRTSVRISVAHKGKEAIDVDSTDSKESNYSDTHVQDRNKEHNQVQSFQESCSYVDVSRLATIIDSCLGGIVDETPT